MRESDAQAAPETGTIPSRYRCQLLAGARPLGRGLVYPREEGRGLLPWARVRRAFAAELGEREGVCTVVFDLVTGIEDGCCIAVRFDAEPGEPARDFARAVERGVGVERCDFSLRSLALDGVATRSHPDLELFERACLESVRMKPFE